MKYISIGTKNKSSAKPIVYQQNEKGNDIKDKFSNGNIPFLVRNMAIPGIISQILLLLYNMVDRIIPWSS